MLSFKCKSAINRGKVFVRTVHFYWIRWLHRASHVCCLHWSERGFYFLLLM